MNAMPGKGQRWINRQNGWSVRVMSDPIEGWVIYRLKGAVPGLLHVSEWHAQYTLEVSKAATKPNAGASPA